ncbi:MAG: DUF4372 domain-containing protein [Cyclobacteriaceae bacterium]|nr:DUF4372 domain-containing protein [Cyclobacteriaceae bacterium]
MHSGKTVFAQLMNFMPEYEFQKCINRHKCNDRVRKRTCREHFLHMSFTQTLDLTQFEKNLSDENQLSLWNIATYNTNKHYLIN